MTTVAERLRREDRSQLRRRTPGERVEEALGLADAAIAAWARARGLYLMETRRLQERGAQQGRAPSKVMRGIVG